MNHRLQTIALVVTLLVGPLSAQDAERLQELVHLERAFQAAATSIAPSVVQVDVEWTGSAPSAAGANSGPFYQRPDAPVSGVVVGADGLVLTTAWNVANEPKSIHVTLADGRRFEARRLGLDEVRDLALLKIEATGLPAAELFEADLRIGQWALVVGRSPSLENHTLTTGIISALDRFDASAFQLDARTNFGSAGGAVVDIEGRLIGIVSRVVAQSNRGQNSGIGFATPSRLVKRYLPRYETGEVIKVPKSPFLGIQADQSVLDVKGVKVAQVIKGTGAEAAGLAEGDIIVGFGEAEIENFNQLVQAIRKIKVGDKVKIAFLRDDKRMEVEATIGERQAGN